MRKNSPRHNRPEEIRGTDTTELLKVRAEGIKKDDWRKLLLAYLEESEIANRGRNVASHCSIVEQEGQR